MIVAPTNNAIEQVLQGVLSVFSEIGFNYVNHVARLGVPSFEFSTMYPDVCENVSFAHKIEEVTNEIQKVTSRLDKFKRYLELLSYSQKLGVC